MLRTIEQLCSQTELMSFTISSSKRRTFGNLLVDTLWDDDLAEVSRVP